MLASELRLYCISAEQKLQFSFSHEEIARLCRLAPVVSRGTQTLQDMMNTISSALLAPILSMPPLTSWRILSPVR